MCPPLVPILSQFNPVQSTHPTSCGSILILSSYLRLGLSSCLFPLRFYHHKPVYTGCGRKNTAISEGHMFGWGAHAVLSSASSNSGVRAVCSVYHGVVGRTSSLYKKWRVAGSNTACISHPLCSWSTGGCSL